MRGLELDVPVLELLDEPLAVLLEELQLACRGDEALQGTPDHALDILEDFARLGSFRRKSSASAVRASFSSEATYSSPCRHRKVANAPHPADIEPSSRGMATSVITASNGFPVRSASERLNAVLSAGHCCPPLVRIAVKQLALNGVVVDNEKILIPARESRGPDRPGRGVSIGLAIVSVAAAARSFRSRVALHGVHWNNPNASGSDFSSRVDSRPSVRGSWTSMMIGGQRRPGLRGLGVACGSDVEALGGEENPRELEVHRVVVNDQDRITGMARATRKIRAPMPASWETTVTNLQPRGAERHSLSAGDGVERRRRGAGRHPYRWEWPAM